MVAGEREICGVRPRLFIVYCCSAMRYGFWAMLPRGTFSARHGLLYPEGRLRAEQAAGNDGNYRPG